MKLFAIDNFEKTNDKFKELIDNIYNLDKFKFNRSFFHLPDFYIRDIFGDNIYLGHDLSLNKNNFKETDVDNIINNNSHVWIYAKPFQTSLNETEGYDLIKLLNKEYKEEVEHFKLKNPGIISDSVIIYNQEQNCLLPSISGMFKADDKTIRNLYMLIGEK
jgi:hypothetical protein